MPRGGAKLGEKEGQVLGGQLYNTKGKENEGLETHER